MALLCRWIMAADLPKCDIDLNRLALIFMFPDDMDSNKEKINCYIASLEQV